MDFQATNSWRVTGRFNNKKDNQEQPYGTTWAGAGSDQLDTLDTLFETPGSNWMISGVGILNNSTSLELSLGRAHNSLDFTIQNQNLTRTAAGLTAFPLLFPDAVQSDYIPDFIFNANNARVGNNAGRLQTDRGPFTNFNTTYDVVANLSKIWGPHAAKFGFYFQSSLKPQSIFASFNSQINFVDNASNPFDTQHSYANIATGVFNTYTQADKVRDPGVALQEHRVVPAGQLEGDQPADAGLRRALLLHDAAVGHDAAGFELPARGVQCQRRGQAVQAGVHRRFPVLGDEPPRDGSRAYRARCRRRRWPIPWKIASSAVSRRAPIGSTARSRPARASRSSCRMATRSERHRASASPTTSPERVRRSLAVATPSFTIGRRATMVFDMITNAPGVLVSTLQWGLLQNLTRRCRRSQRRAVAQSIGARVQAAARQPVERRRAAQDVAELHRRRRLCRFEVGRSAAPGADQRGAVWRHAGAAESGSDPRAGGAAGIVGARSTTCCVRIRATATSGCGTTAATRTTTRCRRRSRGGSTGAGVSRASTSGARLSASTAPTFRLASRT